jgi:hypothetical protein
LLLVAASAASQSTIAAKVTSKDSFIANMIYLLAINEFPKFWLDRKSKSHIPNFESLSFELPNELFEYDTKGEINSPSLLIKTSYVLMND